jgi:flavin-dependent dehydrogenase
MSRSREWDLLIVGAGPAGCAAALQARKAGLSVAILERRAAPPHAPGETLHPGIEPVFERLGVRTSVLAAGFHRHTGVGVNWGSRAGFQAYGADEAGPWLGFQADRRMLQAILWGATLDAGAQLVTRARVAEPVVVRNRVRGVLANGQLWRARWIADATGARAWLAATLGVGATFHSPPLAVRFGWHENSPIADAEPCLSTTEDGWHWRAPLGGGRIAWATLAVRDLAERTRRTPGLDMTWRLRGGCAGPGYFLLGDAAAMVDPSSSHGVLRALMSGMLCGEIVGQHKRGHIPARAAAETYKEWVYATYERDIDHLRQLYREHPSRRVGESFCDDQDIVSFEPDLSRQDSARSRRERAQWRR